MKKINWIITDQTIVVNYDGQTHQLARTDACASQLIKALKENRLDDIPNLVSVSKRLENMSDGMFSLKDGQVLVDGVAAPKALGRKIEEFAKEGLPYEPLVKFAKNLQANPSFRAVNELYQFLEKNNHPITDTGCFVAYKKVRKDFKDIYSGTFDNSVGQVVEMSRNQVNEDPNQTCSHGLHVANWDYANNHYGSSHDTMLEVEVNPADVVAVPVDYNQSKIRACKYKVLSVVKQELSTSLRVTIPSLLNSERYEDINDEEDDLEDDDIECLDCGKELSDYDCEKGYEICSECEEADDEEDNYPWDDELGD